MGLLSLLGLFDKRKPTTKQASPATGPQVLIDGLANVFQKDLERINNIVTGLLQEDGTFRNPAYNFMNKDSCANFSVVLQSQLQKHLKVDLQGMHDRIYLVPRADVAFDARSNIAHKKEELCKVITEHYVKVLQLLTLVKQVYDLEHHGDNSIAGITWRNVQQQGNNLVISFCNMPQKHVDDATDKEAQVIDFARLTGLSTFCNTILAPEERTIFLTRFQTVLNVNVREGEAHHARLASEGACGDALLDPDMYARLFGASKCNKDQAKAFNEHAKVTDLSSLRMTVARGNPVLHQRTCAQPAKVIIDTTDSSADVREVLKLYEQMKKNYINNINITTDAVSALVDANGDGTFSLRNVDDVTLTNVWKDVKLGVAMFYLQSVADFQRLLHRAQAVQSNVVIDG